MIWEIAEMALAERTRKGLQKYTENQQPAEAGGECSLDPVWELNGGLLRFLSLPMQLCPADDWRNWRGGSSTARPTLCRALELMRKGIDEGRAALFGPRSPESAEGSLEKALLDLRDELAPGEWTRIVILGRTRPLEPAIQQQIFAIAREALLNARKHSEASRVEVEIEYERGKVRVVVRDNGVGIDPQVLLAGGNSGLGLVSMRERAASIGATIRVWSKRSGGTEVEISVPVGRKAGQG